MQPNTKRRKPTNLTLPEDLRAKARAYVEAHDLSLSQFVIELMRDRLATEQTTENANAA
jgi:hypothetical protein